MKLIGYIDGMFDMFHVGHLNVIENAKEKCDYLIVGVNSDELRMTYKNKPGVIPFEERIRIVAAIRSVDEVVRVDTLDKEVLWKKKPFDILFSGDDWKNHPRWVETERTMLKYNVKVIWLPYTHTTTSTLLREKLESIVDPI